MMSLSTAARAVQGRLQGPDIEFTAVSTDTRSIRAGDLFVALIGPRFDAHEFVAEAGAAGAVAALVSRPAGGNRPRIEVDDTRLALGRLASWWRGQFDIPVIAVTGSNGKTTVKNMIAAIMAGRGTGIATQGNLNNDIGVPQTLLRLRAGDQYAIIEMGMNHPGEIDYLTRLTRPTVALVNNAGEAHLAGLGSVEAVARAKGEIFAGLPADGVAIINADDVYCGLWRDLAGSRRVVTFGIDQPADVSAEYALAVTGSDIHLKTSQGGITMRLPLLGKHNVRNAVAAASATLAAGARLTDIQAGLEKLRAVSGRLEVKTGVNGARVLDDTYNANPSSVAAGVEVLRTTDGERVLVLGDMGELGDSAADIHRRVGELAKRVGVDRLYAVGELSRHAAAGFGGNARHFKDQAALIDALRKDMHGDMTLLVKGSRSSRMEQVVAGIVAAGTGGNA